MLRNMIRRGIRAVQHGAEPMQPLCRGGKVIPTYSQDQVLSGLPPAATPEADSKLLREIGRKVVEDCQRLAPQPPR